MSEMEFIKAKISILIPRVPVINVMVNSCTDNRTTFPSENDSLVIAFIFNIFTFYSQGKYPSAK